MEEDDVCCGIDLVIGGCIPAVLVLQLLRAELVVIEHVHSECLCYMRRALPYSSEPDDSKRLSAQLKNRIVPEHMLSRGRPSAFMHLIAVMPYTAADLKEKSECVLGHHCGPVSRDVGQGD